MLATKDQIKVCPEIKELQREYEACVEIWLKADEWSKEWAFWAADAALQNLKDAESYAIKYLANAEPYHPSPREYEIWLERA